MDGWHQTRVLTAAQFIGRSLLVQVMTVRRGDSTLLKLRINPKHKDDSVVDRWRYGRPWSYPPIPPVWPLEAVDPWERASFLGPLPGKVKGDALQPCGSCGASTNGPVKYCSECGAPFEATEISFATRVARIVGQVAEGSSTAGADLVAFIEDYTPKSSRAKEGWPELFQFIGEDFAGLSRADFIRGEPALVSPNLTLASAQDIHQSVTATGRVRPEQIQHAELLLRYAPLECGYWGPFKALVKAAPADDMPEAYAEALARLSSYDWSRPAPPSIEIEDVGFLRGFLDSASLQTRMYLARRARRDLAALAERSPDTYARVAARMILWWDQALSHNAFAPAYVMLGALSSLDAHSKHVEKTPYMSIRRDAHPAIWNERPELVQTIFDTVTNSVEAHTWSFQVLESLGHAPPITDSHLKLALLSPYPPLSGAASAALSSRPGVWDSLAAVHWAAIFRSGDDSNFDGILDALSVGAPRPAAVEAARGFLVLGHPAPPLRLLRIAVIFLSANQPISHKSLVDDADAYVAAAVAVINQSATKHKKLWFPVVKGLDLADLQRLRQRLRDGAPNSAVTAVDDQLIRLRFERADPSDAINWIASTNPVEARLGWNLIGHGDRVGGLLAILPQWISSRRAVPSTVERVVDELAARTILADVPQLAKVVEEALDRGVEPTHLVASLTKTPVGLAVMWHSMSAKTGSGLVDAAPAVVRVAGDSISAEQLLSASPGQLLFALLYIKENPARIAGDIDFGVAAATSSASALQAEAIDQLRANGQVAMVWLALAESQVPKAVAAARLYVADLNDGREFRDAVLKCLDSDTASVRDLGADLLAVRMDSSEDREFWTALAESTDSRLEEILAGLTRLATHVDEVVLSDFDRRVLNSSRRNQRARESVKARLDATHADSGLASPARIATLLELARGQRLADKEWALGKLAELALAGVAIEGLGVSLVTTGEDS